MDQRSSHSKNSTLLPFIKMQGIGNDFVVIDSYGDIYGENHGGSSSSKSSSGAGTESKQSYFTPISEISPALAQKLCDRRFGVGADQILWLKKPQNSKLDVRMEILNADGTAAEMCGNGIRAIALYFQATHFPERKRFQVETLGGVKTVEVRGDQVLVDMGPAKLGPGFQTGGEPIQLDSESFTTNAIRPASAKPDSSMNFQDLRFFEVNVGNPHAVFFVENHSKLRSTLASEQSSALPKGHAGLLPSLLDNIPVETLGPIIEHHPRFPKRTNVEFVEVLSPHQIRVRVWERGAGITLACGTGACASAVASIASGRAQSPLEVQLPGGTLKISWQGEAHSVMMEGSAKEVFRGLFALN